jgi:hypothetical protein
MCTIGRSIYGRDDQLGGLISKSPAFLVCAFGQEIVGVVPRVDRCCCEAPDRVTGWVRRLSR